MAIYKTIMTRYGIEAEYWKITSLMLTESKTKREAEVTLSGYLNAEASVTGEPLGEYKFIWRGDEYPYSEPSDNFKTIAYNRIKLTEGWEDGTDI